jgi:NADH-quinone oxidoreductase subunit J
MAAVTTGAGLCVVLPPFGRNPLHAALSLLVAFFFLSGIFILLSAHLVGVLQVLVYAGAVMVLFVFVILLLSLRKEDLTGPRVTPWKVFGVAAGLVFCVKTALIVAAATDGMEAADLAAKPEYGGVSDVGTQLVTTYLFPFEVTSVLLLVAIIGAVVVARKRESREVAK